MIKFIKGIFKAIMWLLAIILVALLAHPLWVGPTVKSVVTNVAPKFTGTPVEIKSCDLNLYAGRVALEGFDVANPKGASAESAAKLGTVRFVMEPLSVMSDVIVINEITIKDLYVSYELIGGKSNFEIIAENATGPKRESTGSEVEVTETKPAEVKPAEPPKSEEKSEEVAEEKPAKKVIIENLTIKNATVVVMGFPVKIPIDIHMSDIGKDTGGVTFADALDQIVTKVMNSAGIIGNSIQDLGIKGLEIGGTALDIGVAGVTNALEAVQNMDVESAKTILKDTGKNIKESTKDFKKLGKDFKNLFK